MQILSNTGGIAATNCYLVADESTGQAVLFDAPDHTVAPLLEEAIKRKWEIIGLWLTHGHFDHTADHALVTQKFPNARVLIHRLDEPKLIQPNTKFFPLPFEIPSRKADGYVEDGQTLKIGTVPVFVIHTPGHAPGHVMYHFPDQNILIGGDLIFVNSVGRTDLPDSDPAEMERSIQRVMKLPPLTRLLPGHAGITTLADEAANNPYVIEALSAS
ncbi:MAG TPA: MBL fold metallo-hydrolase [Tepidisphaeraceae bacterium]|jgi:glyoxylase-like metal-dependent hydrolase (beta-lactamase superfamily II)